MPGIRTNATQRSSRGKDFLECVRCKETKDVINFSVYWYYPRKDGKQIGERQRKRVQNCKDCSRKNSKIMVN